MDICQDDFSLPKPLVGNDERINEWLKKDLMNKEMSNKTYKQMAVRNCLVIVLNLGV